MEKIFIKKTKTTPDVYFNTDDKSLSFIGRCYPENTDILFIPLNEWSVNYNEDRLTIKIELEYFNTASSKQLFNLIKYFLDKKLKYFNVKWYYEIGDEDSLETGHFFENGLDIKFEFITIAEK